MSVVVCDASPLIFLAKLDRLHLIEDLLGGSVVVLKCVVVEVLSDRADLVERGRLEAFLEQCSVLDHSYVGPAAHALSQSDLATLDWAIANQADWLIADERLLRRVARQKGIAVVGFLGLLMEAARHGILTPEAARRAVDEAVSVHGCRISVQIYQALIADIEGLK